MGGIVSPSSATARTWSTGVGRSRNAGLVVAGVELGQGLVDARRVADAALGGDVVLGHAEDSLQDELLEDRGVQCPVGVRAVGEGLVQVGRVSQPQPERVPVSESM